MPEPAALERARALKRHAKFCGMPLKEFCVTVSKAEAYELVCWFRQQADPRRIDVVAFDLAVHDAVEADNPFLILKDFTLLGLDIVPWESLH